MVVKPLVRFYYYVKVPILLCCALAIVSCSHNDNPSPNSEESYSIELMPLSEAWAENSINTSVFRCNSICSDNTFQVAAYYDGEGYITFARRLLTSKKWEIIKSNIQCDCKDAHNGISIAIDGDGYYHIAYDLHASRMTYRRSILPHSLEFGPVQYMVNEEEEQSVSYPEFYKKSDGSLFFVYRTGASGNGNCVVYSYDLSSKTWSKVQSCLINGEWQRNAYWQIYLDNSDNFYISWVWRESGSVETNHDLCYAYSSDGGITWKDSHSNIYQVPITMNDAEIAWNIPQNSELINQTSMTVDRFGHPFIATYWKSPEEIAPQYKIVWNDGLQWNLSVVSNRVTPFTLSGIGTKRIPIARPRLFINDEGGALFLYRDVERGEVVSLAYCSDIYHPNWNYKDLTSFSVEAWEPSVDMDRWKREGVLDVYVQKAYQGDGETSVSAEAEMAYVIEIKKRR